MRYTAAWVSIRGWQFEQCADIRQKIEALRSYNPHGPLIFVDSLVISSTNNLIYAFYLPRSFKTSAGCTTHSTIVIDRYAPFGPDI